MENLFSYGTLQKEDVQMAVFGRTLDGRTDVLRGYKVCSIEIKDETFISRGEQRMQRTATVSDADTVDGMVFEISEQELLVADIYEPTEFKRTRVTLASGKHSWIYIADAAA